MLKIFRKMIHSLINLFGIRKLYIRYIVYNRTVMNFLGWVNSLRWKKIDIILIIWPPAFPFIDEINSYITKYYEITSFEITTIDEKRFEEFIFKLYEIDFANPQKVALKIDTLLNSPAYSLGVVKISIPQPEMVVQDALNRVRCESAGDLKDKIRKKFKDRIPNYVYDVVIHSAEVNYQNKKILKILKQYSA